MSKKSFGLQTLDQKLSYLLKPIFSGNKKEFVLVNNLTKNWEEIIGKKYAKFCYAKSVVFSKDKTIGGKLTIAAHNASVGYFLQNSSELIIERIASFYGFKSITKIIIKQEPKDFDRKVEIVELDAKGEEFLQETISGVEDEELAKTLQKLGRMIFKK
jgi:hypothetical protein